MENHSWLQSCITDVPQEAAPLLLELLDTNRLLLDLLRLLMSTQTLAEVQGR